MYILFVHHVLFLSSKQLEISIKLSFTSSDYRLLYLASTCFLSLSFDFFSLPFDVFHLRWISFASVCLPFAFVCMRLRFSTTP